MIRVSQLVWVSALSLGGIATQRGEGQTPNTTPKPVPYQVASTPWSAAQGGWAGRLVVNEYSTGLGCEICHRDEQAIHGLMRRYPANVFIGLSYHMNYDWFWSDPTEDIFDRFRHWFRYDYPGPVDHSLSLDDIVDGRKTWPVSVANSIPNDENDTMPKWIYNVVSARIDEELRRPPEASIHAQTTVHGGQIRVQVTIDSVKQSSPTPYGLILRILLVGDTVPLYSKNAVSPSLYNLVGDQYMVVYAVAHTPLHVLGLPVPLTGPGSIGSPREYTFDVAAIQRRILGLRQGDTTLFAQTEDTYTSTMSKQDLLESGSRRFTDERDWHLDPLHLRVVAIVQDAGSGEVLQAALLPVDGKRLVLR